MKKILLKLKTHIVASCYFAAFAIYILYSVFNFSYYGILRAGGNLTTQQIQLSQLTVYNLQSVSQNVVFSTNEDPQIIFSDDFGAIETLTVQMQFSSAPGEMALYYTTKQGEGFGQHKRVWATEKADGVYVYKLPLGAKQLRLDPGNVNQNTIYVNSIVLNEQKSFFKYFAIDAGGALILLVLPILTAAFISFVLECKNHYFLKNK